MSNNIVETSKKSFMIINRDNAYKKKNYYNLYIFKLKEDRTDQNILSYTQKPIFRGMVQLEKIGSEDGAAIEAFKFWKRIKPPDLSNLDKDMKYNLQPINPRLFKKIFLNVKFIVIPHGTDKKSISSIYEMSERYQDIQIRQYNLCHSCNSKKKFTILGKDSHFIGSNNKKICKECAGVNLFKILTKTYNIDVSPHLKSIISRQLLKFKSIPIILKSFASNFNPLANKELTLFDIRKETKNLIKKLGKVQQVKIKNLEIPELLKKFYYKKKIFNLLPIQSIAVKQGLLNQKDLLVVSSTSSGKTMIGELAGFKKVLESKIGILEQTVQTKKEKNNNSIVKDQIRSLLKTISTKKILYLVPIVALANVRFDEYKELKRIGIIPALKVGKSFIEKEIEEEFGKISRSDLIIGTYEAIDVILRSGNNIALKNADTIIIDEIQMLNDKERGWILDGLISRLKYVNPKSQFIFLSATISDPKILADHYKCRLIELKGRPVPLERHLIFSMNDFDKTKSILLLADEEFKKISSYGFKGQTLVFTNSRRKTQSISQFLSNNGVSASAYHGGLTLDERRRIEGKFTRQQISTVVTTAALAAGVDFPASQVIFESLSMGIKWLTVAEFEQMSGRAGRYRKHDVGKVVLLIEPGKSYHSGQLESEEKTALKLLKGKIESIKLESDEDRMFTEILAFMSMNRIYSSLENIEKFQNSMFNNDFSIKSCLNFLRMYGFIKRSPDKPDSFRISDFGKASAESFFSVKTCLKIRESLEKDENLFNIKEHFEDNAFSEKTEEAKENNAQIITKIKNTSIFEDNLSIQIALDISPFRNIYVSNAVVKEVGTRSSKGKSSLLFNNNTLSLLSAENLGQKRKLSRFLKDLLLIWTREIFNCGCKESPYCGCGRKKIENRILYQRYLGKHPSDIMKELHSDWNLKIYKGDLFDYIDAIIHNLKSIYKIGKTVLGSVDIDDKIKQDILIIPNVIKKLSRM
jgi:helicase